MLGEFKCNQHVFVDLFRKKFVFYIAIQMRMFLTNMFQNSLLKRHARK